MRKQPNSPNYSVPALDKGMEIFEFLATQTIPLSQSEIAQGLDRSPNEIYRVLVGLEKRGYLVREEISGKYHLSLKLFTLTRSIFPVHHIRQAAMPYMDELASKIGLRCHLSLLYRSQAMIIVEARSPGPISLTMAEGSVFPITTTASGRILLANSLVEVQDMMLERDDHYNAFDSEERKNFRSKLDHIRLNGYEFSDSEITQGVTDCAALVGEPDGVVIASLAVSLISSSRSKPIERDNLITSIKSTASAITKQLGLLTE